MSDHVDHGRKHPQSVFVAELQLAGVFESVAKTEAQCIEHAVPRVEFVPHLWEAMGQEISEVHGTRAVAAIRVCK